MLMNKKEIIELLQANGDMATAHTAQANLPEEFDTENDRDLLAQHGIDVEYRLSRR